jgi:hypothetical protein
MYVVATVIFGARISARVTDFISTCYQVTEFYFDLSLSRVGKCAVFWDVLDTFTSFPVPLSECSTRICVAGYTVILILEDLRFPIGSSIALKAAV